MAHRLVYHSTLGVRVITRKKKHPPCRVHLGLKMREDRVQDGPASGERAPRVSSLDRIHRVAFLVGLGLRVELMVERFLRSARGPRPQFSAEKTSATAPRPAVFV